MEASERNCRKLEASVEFMEVFTTSMEAPTSMEGSITKIYIIYMKKIFLRFVKLGEMV